MHLKWGDNDKKRWKSTTKFYFITKDAFTVKSRYLKLEGTGEKVQDI
jgi:hypothetical protein